MIVYCIVDVRQCAPSCHETYLREGLLDATGHHHEFGLVGNVTLDEILRWAATRMAGGAQDESWLSSAHLNDGIGARVG